MNNRTGRLRASVFACSGNERQAVYASELASDILVTPTGIEFTVRWMTPGYSYSAAVLGQIDRAILEADAVVVGVRLAHGFRSAVLHSARAYAKPVTYLSGSGTGKSGVVRAASDAVERLMALKAVAS